MKTTRLATAAIISALATGARIDIEGQPDALPQGHEGQDLMLAQTSRSKVYTVEYQNALAKKDCDHFYEVNNPCYLYRNAWGSFGLKKYCYDWTCISNDGFSDSDYRRWCFNEEQACDADYE